MYAKMIEDMQANMKQAFDMKSYETAMKPMTDLFEINKATVEALADDFDTKHWHQMLQVKLANQ